MGYIPSLPRSHPPWAPWACGLAIFRRPNTIAVLLLLHICLPFPGGEAITLGPKWTMTPPSDDRDDKIKFGQATCVSSDGRRLLVGANGRAQFAGAVYVYDLASGDGSRAHHWRRTRLTGSDAQGAEHKRTGELRLVNRGSGFGFSCAMDGSGNILFIGAPGHDLQRGTVYAFSFDSRKRRWKEIHRIDAPEKRSSDSFGWAISASSDGTSVAISAKGRRAHNGEVFVYNRNGKETDDNGKDQDDRKDSQYSLSARIPPPDFTDAAGPRGIRIRNNFGASLSISADGNLMAVGCTGFNREQGAVYVMQRIAGKQSRENDNGEWELLQRLVSPVPQDFAFFGFKLAMDAAGTTIAIGADGEESYKGAVYVFDRKNETYFGDPSILQAEHRVEEDNYGGSIALSGNGFILTVGSPGAKRYGEADHGMVYLYSRTQSAEKAISWNLASKEMLDDSNTQKGGYYSWSVALSGTGERLIVSAPEAYGQSGIVTVGKVNGFLDLNAGNKPVTTSKGSLGSGRREGTQQAKRIYMDKMSANLPGHDEL